jgi:hypothetical protein
LSTIEIRRWVNSRWRIKISFSITVKHIWPKLLLTKISFDRKKLGGRLFDRNLYASKGPKDHFTERSFNQTNFQQKINSHLTESFFQQNAISPQNFDRNRPQYLRLHLLRVKYGTFYTTKRMLEVWQWCGVVW